MSIHGHRKTRLLKELKTKYGKNLFKKPPCLSLGLPHFCRIVQKNLHPLCVENSSEYYNYLLFITNNSKLNLK